MSARKLWEKAAAESSDIATGSRSPSKASVQFHANVASVAVHGTGHSGGTNDRAMLATRTAGPGHRALRCRCRFRRGAPGAGGRARRHPAPRLPGVGGSCRPGGTACLGLGLSATQEPSAGGSAAPEPRGAPRAGSAPSRCHAPLAPDAFSRRFRSLPPHSTRRRGCPSPGERPSRGGGAPPGRPSDGSALQVPGLPPAAEPPPEDAAEQSPCPPPLREPVLRYLRRHRAHLPMYAPAGADGAGPPPTAGETAAPVPPGSALPLS